MKLVQVFLAVTLLLFTVTGFAARKEKVAVCHVNNSGKVNLIVVSKNANHLGNTAHEFDGLYDYEPSEVGASGDGTEDSNGDGIDDGCEPAEGCPCWDQAELLSVTSENNRPFDSCAPESILPNFAGIQNIEGSTPDVEGGFAAEIDEPSNTFCGTRDYGTLASITVEKANVCIAQIAARCAAIGDPIPIP